MSDQNLTFRPDLQGLRAVAILLVILGHSGLAIAPGGFIGVDVFFVLSGYLITGLLLRELEQGGRISLIPFYARRLKRLLPALIFMLSVSAVLATWILSGAEARIQLTSSPFAATWTSNLYFAFTQNDYFNELASRDLFLHTWSLGVEEQFYLIWPVVLMMLLWAGKLRSETKQSEFGIMFPGLVMVFVASFILSLYWTKNLPQAAFYLMPSRIWQFSLGALVYLILRSYFSQKSEMTYRSRKLSAYITLGAGLILILVSAILLHPGLAYPGFWALVPSLGAALVIVAGHILPKNQNGPLAHPVLVWLGDRSYSLYLWHWPIFMLGFSIGLQGQVLPTLGMMLLSMLVAVLTFRLIELPFWKGRYSHARPRHINLVSFFVMASVILVMSHGLSNLPQPNNSSAAISNKWRADVPDIYKMGCDAWYFHSRVEPCVFDGGAATKTVVFLGDSIGAQWFSTIPEIFPEPLWRIIVLTKSSCPMVDEDYFYPRIGRIFQVCTDWRNAVIDVLDSLKPDVLIMGSRSTYSYSDTQWLEGSFRVFRRVSSSAKSVFVIPGTPSLGFDGPGCIARNISSDGLVDRDACQAEGRMQQIEAVTKLLDKTVNRFPNLYLLNLNDLVCPDGNCNAISKEGLVVFRDSQHLTDSFVRSQVPFVREKIMRFYKGSGLSSSVAQK